MSTAYRDFEYKALSDLYRITGTITASALLKQALVGEGFKVALLLRLCDYSTSSPRLRFTVHPVARLLLRHYSYKFGITVSPVTDIGPGFYIGHTQGIVVSHRASIGRNCNLSQGVTIGVANRGPYKGHPVVGDNVYIGPGAKVFGSVAIGKGAAIGANCVVNRDVPPGVVAVGVPARVVSESGSNQYVNRTDYDEAIANSQRGAGLLRRMLLRGDGETLSPQHRKRLTHS